MATTAKVLIQGTQLGTAIQTLYTPSAGNKGQIKKLTATNVTANTVTITLYKVPASGAAGVTNAVIVSRNVPGSVAGQVGTLELYEIEGDMLEAGDSLQGLCSVAAAVTIHGSGIELS